MWAGPARRDVVTLAVVLSTVAWVAAFAAVGTHCTRTWWAVFAVRPVTAADVAVPALPAFVQSPDVPALH